MRSASLWWSADGLGAALFAGALAFWLGSAIAGRTPLAGALALGALAFSGAFRGFAQARGAVQGQIAATAAKQALRARLFAAFLPTGFRRGRLPGEDMRTAIDDVETLDGYIGRFAPLRKAAVLSPLACAALAAFGSWVAATIMLATLVPFALGMMLAGTAARVEAERQHLALSRMTGLFVDRARTLPTIVSFGAENRVTRQIASAAQDVATRTLRVLRIAFVSSAVLEFFAALSVALVAVYCGFSLLGILPFTPPETLDLARAFFVLALAPEFYLGMRRMAAAYHDKQQGEAALAAMEPELAKAERLVDQARPFEAVPKGLGAENLLVRYDDGSTIGPFSAQWPETGLHAIVGPTGAGKSSLLHALVGMVPVVSGRMVAAGQDIMPGALNPHIGWSGQRPLLLPGTLEDNLLLGNAEAANWRDLAQKLGLDALLDARGGDLVIDPVGAGLSGGERRRIGLARAILSGRPILLLDEPTADLDAATAQRVVDVLHHIAHTRLVIVATHDPLLRGAAQSTLACP
ncbi:ABC transporter ATP-binding protein/permease [Novosphingobium sp. ERN07]|uniref:ABC transporter ATP-binding protein/permease n=1 Tax=Novosphingobium sp. ERN07 TaxID=2726187 RepID=UPI001F0FB57D|nr:ATP-binding cassette domain-containing protein [Novosphingobium sp. ERN07]